METNQQSQDQQSPQNAAGKEQEKNTNAPGEARKDSLDDSELEDPAAESEIGANIYDIGMGGPGASTSGLRSGSDTDENEDD
jgi:hypothetical protein